MTHLRILVADDHAIVRHALKEVLDTESDFTVVAVVSSGEAAVERTLALAPDIVLMDIRMPGSISGIEACEQINCKLPNTHVLMLTALSQDDHLEDAIQAGAAGYMLKRVTSSQLIEGIRKVAHGEEIFDAVQVYRKEWRRFGGLNDRQLAILALIGKGLTNYEIGRRLCLAEGTVRNYVHVILDTLDVPNRARAAVLAVKHDLDQFIALMEPTEQVAGA